MDLGLRFKKIHDIMKKQANQELEELGLTFSQHHVLVYLSFQENGEAPLKELEKHAEVAQSTMAGIVARLEDKGYIESFTDETDHRIKKVRLSATGSAICQKSKENLCAKEASLRGTLTPSELTELERLLDRVYESLKQNAQKQEVTV